MQGKFFQNKTILIISPESWSHLFVSKHHYAIELAKRGNRVFFLNPPVQSFSFRSTEYKNVWEVDHKPFLKGLRFFPSFVQKFLFKRRLKKIESIVSQKIDCIWSFDNSIFFDFSFLDKNVFSISHIVDYSQNFQFEKTASSAKLCLGVTKNIVDRLAIYSQNSFLIPHGVALDLSQPVEVKLQGTNKIKAVYAGNLDSKYLDKETLFLLVKNYPLIDFIFFGSGGKDWTKADNLFLPGVIKHEFLTSYLERADILLIIYNFKKFPEQLTNAHKVLEYLNAGKVIVSNFIPDYYSDNQGLIQMANSNTELIDIFDKAVSNLPEFNSYARMEKRKAFAKINSYSKRIEEIEVLIDNLDTI